MGEVEPWTSVGAASTSCYHTDMLGTTRYMTTPDDGQKERGGATGGGLATEGATYTAFGERICTLDDSCGPTDPNPRYGYAGAHGYRAQDTAEDPGSDPVPFLHVGARYYDPAIGRFLQRDPIGIEGGLNVYAYVANRPTMSVDPSGKWLIPVLRGIWTFGRRWIAPKAARAGGWAWKKGIKPAATYGMRKITPHALRFGRWMNRGKFRVGPSCHAGKIYFAIRWKNKHWNLFEL